jgi:diguanylate cyclase (GGDEF)-like protein
LLILTLIVTYITSIVARISALPAVCFTSVMAATVPGAIAFGWRVGGAQTIPAVAMEIFIISAFAVSSLSSVAQNYRSTMQQVLDRWRLASMVGRDALTGLPNRSMLPARFAESITLARRSGEIVAVHCLDLDRFKSVNDTFGHPVGDALLQAAARRLSGVVREHDTVARIGGDEFVVIQAGVGHADQALMLAKRIVHDLSARYSLGDHMVEIGVSVGIAFARRDAFDLERLIADADVALYRAKRERRGVVIFEGAANANCAAA